MLILTRPKSGRIVTGVALGISELYGVSVTILRIVFVAAMIAAPIGVLVYLLLSISTPNESSVAGVMTFQGIEAEMQPRERFTRFSQVLVQRLIYPRSESTFSDNLTSVALLVIATLLELPKVQGARYYFDHPVISMLVGDLTRIGTSVFYIALAVIFSLKSLPKTPTVSLEIREAQKFSLDGSVRKIIGGVAGGVSAILQIDPAYIRIILLILNILTFGILGVLYLLILYFFRRKDRLGSPKADEQSSRLTARYESVETSTLRKKNSILFHFGIALLFLALAAVRISSGFRIIFFNEPFILGLLIALAGIIVAWHGALSVNNRNDRETTSIFILSGSSMFFAGIYFLAISIGRVEVTAGENIEIGEIIAALSIAYFGVVALNNRGRRMAFLFALILGLCAVSIGFHIMPVRDLAAAGQFYDFFYPVIFGVLALWIAYEK